MTPGDLAAVDMLRRGDRETALRYVTGLLYAPDDFRRTPWPDPPTLTHVRAHLRDLADHPKGPQR